MNYSKLLFKLGEKIDTRNNFTVVEVPLKTMTLYFVGYEDEDGQINEIAEFLDKGEALDFIDF